MYYTISILLTHEPNPNRTPGFFPETLLLLLGLIEYVSSKVCLFVGMECPFVLKVSAHCTHQQWDQCGQRLQHTSSCGGYAPHRDYKLWFWQRRKWLACGLIEKKRKNNLFNLKANH